MRAFRSQSASFLVCSSGLGQRRNYCLSQQIQSRRHGLKIVRIVGRLTGGPARQACLLHERLTAAFDTRLITGNLSSGEHDMSDLLHRKTTS